MQPETYELECYCKNCNFEGRVTISKGMTLAEIHCPTCKTKMLDKKHPPMRLTPHIENYR